MISEPQGMTSILSIKNRVSKLCIRTKQSCSFHSLVKKDGSSTDNMKVSLQKLRLLVYVNFSNKTPSLPHGLIYCPISFCFQR